MNWNVIMRNDSTFEVAQPTTLTFSTGVYQQTVKVMDEYGLPVQGAAVNVTSLNGVSVILHTDRHGTAQFRVPDGPFSATISFLGENDQIVSDSNGSHSYTVGVLLSYPLIATIGVAMAFVIASFIYFWRRRKPVVEVYIPSRQ
jgi:hypothetical protein